MSDSLPEPTNDETPPEQPRSGKIGVGTVSIMFIFFAIIGAMCVGAAMIMAVLIFR